MRAERACLRSLDEGELAVHALAASFDIPDLFFE
jgi:hypothetical protein